MSVSRFIDCADFSHEEISDLIALAHRLQPTRSKTKYWAYCF